MKDLDRAVQLEPQDPRTIMWRGQAKQRCGLYKEAIEDYDRAFHLELRDVEVLKWRGRAKYMLELYSTAIKDFDQVLKLEPEDFLVLKWRAEAKQKLGRFDEVILDCDRALRVWPKDLQMLRWRAEAKCGLKRHEEAIKDLNEALELQPMDFYLLKRRADVKCHFGHYEQAVVDLDMALELVPKNSAVRRALNQAMRLLGHPSEAQNWWLNRIKNVHSVSDRIVGTFDIIGAGPVGLCLAMSLTKQMIDSSTPPASPRITVHEAGWIAHVQGRWQRNAYGSRDQVVTLQDDVVKLFPEEVRACLEGEDVWRDARNVPVSQIEDRLLQKVQEPPFSFIRLSRCEHMRSAKAQAEFIKQLQGDIIVASDGAASLSRQAFPGAFVCPRSLGANAAEERICLGQTEQDMEEVDSILSVSLEEEAALPQRQLLNRTLSLAQNIYLLNSKGSKGVLNIRITKEEYEEIIRAAPQGCPLGSPIQIVSRPMDVDGSGPALDRVELPWLRRRIEQGLRLFGIRDEHVVDITGFQLAPAYVEHFCHVLPADKHVDHQRVLLLAGDAAISHHVWPGRGCNSGLESVKAIAQLLESQPFVDGLHRYSTFMRTLRAREMRRSASMMQKSLRLDWGSALARAERPWSEWILGVDRQADLIREASELESKNRCSLLQRCQLCRDGLEDPAMAYVHDATLEDAILRAPALELHLMVRSGQRPPCQAQR